MMPDRNGICCRASKVGSRLKSQIFCSQIGAMAGEGVTDVSLTRLHPPVQP